MAAIHLLPVSNPNLMRFATSLLSGSIAFLLTFSLQAQHAAHEGPCGMTRADLDVVTTQLLSNMAMLEEYGADLREGSTTYIPVKFHIVNRTNGTGGVPLERVLEMLCGINEFYADQNLVFFIRNGINTINNTTLFDNPQSEASILLMLNSRVTGTLNIFLTDQTGAANILGYYTPGQAGFPADYIVIRRSEIGYRKNTIEHEIGHYFQLLHTFNGWECEPWESNLHGKPLNSSFAPCNSAKAPFGAVLAELADGSNGGSSGDFISDTPADYNLGLGWPNCQYTGGAQDKNGVPLDPDEKNIMSYFLSCPEYHLSPIQKQLIGTDITSRKNAGFGSFRFLNTNATPVTGDTGPITALAPPDNGLSNGNTNVKLEWAAGPGAQRYVVRIDRFQSFGFQPRYYYTNAPEVVLDFTLVGTGKYFWQVYAYNDFQTCPLWGPTFSFNVGASTALESLPGLTAMAVLPQPLAIGQALQVHMDLERPMDLDLEILDLNGRILHREAGLSMRAGEQTHTSAWFPGHSGLYLMRWSGAQGSFTKRVAVH
jgi:hypothetical protein